MPAPNSLGNILSVVTRDQGPEFEQTLNWANTTQLSTPTSLRTDRKVRFLDFHMRGRITVGAGVVTFRTAPTVLGTPLFSLLQQITIRGQHARYGFQVPVVIRGETAAEWMALQFPNYAPRFSVSVNGAALVQGAALSGAANATNDFDFVLPVPLFPVGLSPSDQTFYSLHGPDWPGNLYVDINTADVTALGVTLASIANGGTVTAFGSAAGTGTIDILSERPLVTKGLANRIRPGVVFRITNTQQPTAIVSAGGGAGVKIADLTVGKDTSRIFVKAGTSQAATSAGVVAYATLSDTIITRTFFSLDNRNLRFQNANADSTLQDYMGRAYGRNIPAGYRLIDFVAGVGSGTDNVRGVFPSSQLTAARKYELDGDVTATAGNIAEMVQEMILGQAELTSQAPAAS